MISTAKLPFLVRTLFYKVSRAVFTTITVITPSSKIIITNQTSLKLLGLSLLT